jgi:chromosome segregation ATPase
MALSDFFFGSRMKPASMTPVPIHFSLEDLLESCEQADTSDDDYEAAVNVADFCARENNSFGSSTLPWTDSSPLGSPGTVSTLDSREKAMIEALMDECRNIVAEQMVAKRKEDCKALVEGKEGFKNALAKEQRELNKLSARVSQNEKKLTKHDLQITGLQEGNAKLRDKILGAQKENLEVKREVTSFKEENLELRREVAGLKEENLEVKREVTILKEENLEIKREVVSLKEENLELKGEVKSLKEENLELRVGVHELEGEMAMMRAQFEVFHRLLEGEMTMMRVQFAEFQRSLST